MNPLLTKTFFAGAAINPFRIVKFGADDDHVIQAAAVADVPIGVIDRPSNAGATVAEDQVDVITHGIAFIEAGGTFARGDYLTTDATGRGIAAAPGAGVNNNVIGIAMESAVVGDITRVMIHISRIQG